MPPPPVAVNLYRRCCAARPSPTIPRPTSLPVSATTKPARHTNRTRAAEALAGLGINGAWTLVNHG